MNKENCFTLFAVFCTAKQTLAFDGSVLTKEGEGFWLVDEPGGWVAATSAIGQRSSPPEDVKIWNSDKLAREFMKHWDFHPWYHEPKSWEIIPLQKVMKTVPTLFLILKIYTLKNLLQMQKNLS
jgi:hypothetical protein